MAYENSEAFGLLNLFDKRYPGVEMGRYGREILTLVDVRRDQDDLLPVYHHFLGVLGEHMTEAARARVIHYEGTPLERTVLAEHAFLINWSQNGTPLESMEGDGRSYVADGVSVTYDRKVSAHPIGWRAEVALQYDGLVSPPALRVVDILGADRQGRPVSDLPPELIQSLESYPK